MLEDQARFDAVADAFRPEVIVHLAAQAGVRYSIEDPHVYLRSNAQGALNLMELMRQHDCGKLVLASTSSLYAGQPMPFREDLPVERPLSPYAASKKAAEILSYTYHHLYGLDVSILRYFTVYGPRCQESHAVIAMIARAFIGQDPFVVWGNGDQIRNWTHVSDIVEGTILAAEHIHDGTAINLGTIERTRVIDCAREILKYTGHQASIELHPEMPTGPLNRVADNSLAQQLLHWRPQVSFVEGLRRTIDWYYSSKNRDEVAAGLSAKLLEH